MKRIFILSLAVLFTSFSYGQTILETIKTKVQEDGLKYIDDAKWRLQENGMGSMEITLSPGKYKILGLGGFSQVKDIDLFIYNYATDELIAKETAEVDGISILDITLEKSTKLWIKVYNRKSSPPYEHYDCYLLIMKN